jgi:hypothetical protein
LSGDNGKITRQNDRSSNFPARVGKEGDERRLSKGQPDLASHRLLRSGLVAVVSVPDALHAREFDVGGNGTSAFFWAD